MLPGPASAVFLRECTWVCVHVHGCVCMRVRVFMHFGGAKLWREDGL